jgi:hypothetical protein
MIHTPTSSAFRPLSRAALAAIGLCLAATCTAKADMPAPTDRVQYSRDIKPLLSDRCYACHGPDQGQRKADLLLHVRESATREAVVPGDAAASPLLQRIASQDPDERMPPPDSKKLPLTAEEIELVRRWIDQGAQYDTHWSFLKPIRSEPPAVFDAAWAKNSIDQFVAAGHAEHRLVPAPEVDRRTLIRRLSFDLIGLPPTPAESDAFAADTSADAYERLVERLLASEHYGERMAMYWLDLVRYGDSGGYHSDNDRAVWMYRDYVIRAFNSNKPFDRFTLEQLAGDLLPAPTDEMRVASGYNRLLMTTEEGGAQPREYLAKYSADRVRNASTVWMAATMGCSECHDHKFDPYTTRDFYSFAAFFADISELAVGRQPQTPLPTDDQKAESAAIDAQVSPLQDQLAATTPELLAGQARWEEALRNRPEWTTLVPTGLASQGEAILTVLDDGSILVSGAVPEKDTYTLTLTATLQDVTGVRLEVLPDDSLPARGPGRAGNGNFVLHELELAVGDAQVEWGQVTASHSQQDFPAAAAGDGNSTTGWAILPQAGAANHAVFEAKAALGDGLETTLTFRLRQDFGGGHSLGRFRLSTTTAPRPVRAEGGDGLPKEVAALVALPAESRTDDDRQAITAYYRTIAPELQPIRDQLAELVKRREAILQAAPTTLVSMAVEPRVIRVLPRGNWLDETGEIVEPAVPDFLAPWSVKDRRATRMDLAEWLVSPENPAVARVMVNRLWKIMFGQGLVKTLDDFGTQGALPSHPALLDWLAVEFRESGWDVKHMLRLMAHSASYRQSSQAVPGQREIDPGNVWLARQGRFRLDAELVRDNALAVSGLLVPTVGGPSVKPYQPDGYWSWLNFPVRDWVHDQGENQYRRGLYTWWQRTFLHPSLLAFDASTREECTVDRPRSNTPLQALVLLNDPTYVEAARVFAQRIIAEGGPTTGERLGFAMRRALGRVPDPREAAILSDLVERHRAQFAAAPDAAGELLHVGEAPPPAGADPIELAAWTSVARVILNLHETVTRY